MLKIPPASLQLLYLLQPIQKPRIVHLTMELRRLICKIKRSLCEVHRSLPLRVQMAGRGYGWSFRQQNNRHRWILHRFHFDTWYLLLILRNQVLFYGIYSLYNVMVSHVFLFLSPLCTNTGNSPKWEGNPSIIRIQSPQLSLFYKRLPFKPSGKALTSISSFLFLVETMEEMLLVVLS